MTSSGNKRAAVVLIVLVLVLVVLSGCLGSEKPSDPEELYWWHLDEASRLAGKSEEIWQEIKQISDDEEQELLLLEMLENEKDGYYHELTAMNLTNDPQKKEHARLRSESRKYYVMHVEELITASRYLQMNDTESAKIHANNAQSHVDQALALLSRAKSIRPERSLISRLR